MRTIPDDRAHLPAFNSERVGQEMDWTGMSELTRDRDRIPVFKWIIRYPSCSSSFGLALIAYKLRPGWILG
jgi:hypothetical protein